MATNFVRALLSNAYLTKVTNAITPPEMTQNDSASREYFGDAEGFGLLFSIVPHAEPTGNYI